MPFSNQYQRDIHFKKHGSEVGAKDAVEYEQMADGFMFGNLTLAMRECNRASGSHRVRIHILNRRIGIADIAPPESLRSFYVAPLHTVVHHGGAMNYLAFECARTDV